MVDVLAADELVEEPSDFGALHPGTRLGRYELLIPVARGGMARVWAARQHGQRGFTKLVAIKTILPHLAREEEFERMFLDEARIASGVHHPNVCEIYELGDERGTLYMAMEWVTADSLSRVLRASGKVEPIDARVAARVIADACAGLHAAHELTDDSGRHLGVVHRDLSPHNILLTADGVAKVADFGVAKALGQLHEATSAGQLKGKISYMAPEQVTGAEVDRRSDVFSLGCVLYESTTGHKPFKGDGDHQVMHALLQGEVVPPSQIIRSYPQALERIVLRALSSQPLLRFPTAEQMRFALEEFLARSGQLVTQANVAQTVRARIGPLMDRRKERIRLATQAGDRDAWQDAAHMTPSGARATSASGVKQSMPAPQARPVYTTHQMQRPDPSQLGRSAEVPAPTGAPVLAAPPYAEPPGLAPQGFPPHGPLSRTDPMAPVPAPQQPGAHPPAPPAQSLSKTLALASPFSAIEGAPSPMMTGPQPAQPGYGPPPAPLAAPPNARGYVATGSHSGAGVDPPPPPVPSFREGVPASTPEAPPRSATGHYAIAIAIGVGLAVVIGGGGFLAMRRSKARTVEVHPTPSGSPASTSAPLASGAAPTALAGASATIAFNVSPAQAVLVLDGKDLDKGVRSVPRPPPGTTVSVHVRADGYDDAVIQVDAFTKSPVEMILRESRPALELGEDAGAAAAASGSDPAPAEAPKPVAKPKPAEPAMPDNPY